MGVLVGWPKGAGVTQDWVLSHNGEGRSLCGVLPPQTPSLKKINSTKAKVLFTKEGAVIRLIR